MSTPKSLVSVDVLKRASIVSPWKSALLIFGIYLFVFMLAILGGGLTGWWLAPISIVLIGGLQHHLLILLHEGAHYLIHPDKEINDFYGDLFCAIPFLTLQRNYRVFHLTHHRNTGDPEADPEVDMYTKLGHFYQKRTKEEFKKMLLKTFCGSYTFKFMSWTFSFQQKMIKEGKLKRPGLKDLFRSCLFWGPIFLGCYLTNSYHYILIFWFIPMVFVAMPCLILHGFGEHTGANVKNEFDKTLTHHFHPVTNYFLYPIKSGFHVDHHIFPTVPWYNVNAFREELLKNPVYQKEILKQSVDGYFFGEKTVVNKVLIDINESNEDLIPSKV